MKFGVLISLFVLIAVPAYALNSLARHQDLQKLRDLGLGQEVIDYFLTHQTASLTSKDLLDMRRSGMTDEEILSAIESDLYDTTQQPTPISEADLIARLKESGLSDEAILQFMDRIRSTRQIDLSGRIVTRYTTEFRRNPYPTSGSEFPPIQDYAYDPVYGRYFIFVRPPRPGDFDQ